MRYVDYVYEILKKETTGMDAVYDDYILSLVGVSGLHDLLINNLLESCGSINDNRLYAICEKPGEVDQKWHSE